MPAHVRSNIHSAAFKYGQAQMYTSDEYRTIPNDVHGQSVPGNFCQSFTASRTDSRTSSETRCPSTDSFDAEPDYAFPAPISTRPLQCSRPRGGHFDSQRRH